MPIFCSSCISHVSPMNNQMWLQWFAFAAFTCISRVGYSSLGHEVYVPTLDWHLCSPEGCLAISVLVIAYLNAPLVSPVVTLFTWQNCSPGFHQLFQIPKTCHRSLVPAILHLDVQSSCTSAVHTWQLCRIDLILRYRLQSGSLPSCQPRSDILPSRVSRLLPTHRLGSVMLCHG